MSEEWVTIAPNGEKYKIALEELALFFNNNTIIYGYLALKPGLNRHEALEHLQAAGFDEWTAPSFLRRIEANGGVYWLNGKLVIREEQNDNNE